MKKIICLLTIVFTCLSCSNNDKEVASLVKDKVETMSGHEVVRDLLIENEGDVEQLSRIFKCSVSTINRVKDKETYLTDNALSEFKNLLVAVKVSGENTFKENDPYYDSWIRSFKYWLNDWIWWAIGLWVLMIILGAIMGAGDNIEGSSTLGSFVSLPLIVIFGGGYLVTWIGNMISSYENPAFLFLEKINPLFETLL